MDTPYNGQPLFNGHYMSELHNKCIQNYKLIPSLVLNKKFISYCDSVMEL